jgi:peroxiredoxin Q/BCP
MRLSKKHRSAAARPRILTGHHDGLKATKGRHLRRELVPGAKAPAFKLPRDGGGTITLAAFAGRQLVLYFYPRADTPGCTREAIEFSALKRAYARADTDILGISADPVAAQEAFKRKHAIALALASDEQHKMLAAYGAWQKKTLYGRTFMGVMRKTYLIGRTGRILRIWPKVKVEGHAEEVLAAARDAAAASE